MFPAASFDAVMIHEANDLLRRSLALYRRALAKRKGAGWIAEIEAKYYKPKPGRTTSAPPPPIQPYVD